MLRGRFLIGSGSTAEGIDALLHCAEQAETAGSNQMFLSIALYLALGYLNAGDRERARGWLRRSLDKAERYGLESVYLEERDDSVTVLTRLSRDLEFSESLSQLLIRLHHPALLRQLYHFRPPRGKLLFLRALSVHDATAFLPRVLAFASDQERDVRHTAKSLLAGWNNHTTYRINTFGSFRVFIENRLLPDSVWIRSAVKMLFLFLLNNPGRWLSYDVIMENLWHDADPGSSHKVLINRYSDLRKIIEPWHDRTGKYVFLQSQPGGYGFFPQERVWVDADEFAEQVKLAESARLSRSFRKARKAYRRALDLYLGDYLEEFPYEDWLSQKRAYLRDLYFRSAARYAALERDSGNPGEARRVLEEALFRDIGNTECLHLLLEVLQKMKLRTEAREWALRHADFMKKELQADVDPEVSAIIAG
jgi:DNA-binding SARP family transcriptional activator